MKRYIILTFLAFGVILCFASIASASDVDITITGGHYLTGKILCEARKEYWSALDQWYFWSDNGVSVKQYVGGGAIGCQTDGYVHYNNYDLENLWGYWGAGGTFQEWIWDYTKAFNEYPTSTPNFILTIRRNGHNDWTFESLILSNDNNVKSPVLIIPGVLGTEMKKDENLLWVDFTRMFFDVGDNFMDSLLFNKNLTPIDETISLFGVIKKKTFTFFSYDYTEGLIQEFTNQGYTENQDLFTFPYDWRYGVSGIIDQATGKTNVDLLKQKIQDILTQTGADKVDVVAHSTGGLLVKKYVMDNSGDHHLGKAVFAGVPNTGAPKAVKTLLVGDNFGIPWLAEEEMQKIAQNLPVIYDLAPSQTYFDRVGSFVRVISQNNPAQSYQDLNYQETGSFLLNDHQFNATAYQQAQALHSLSFDDLDLRTKNIDVYNIAGCKTGTLSKILENRLAGGTTLLTLDYIPTLTSGDSTVPLNSATNLLADASHKYYAPKVEHGKMLSQDGVRQQIVNIIAGANLPTNKITQDIDQCNLNGQAIAIYSPVEIEVYDESGQRLGKADDGSLQNDIPGADFEVFGDHKFIYLPSDSGEHYEIKLKGAGVGTFTLKNQLLVDGAIAQSENFVDIPVTPALVGQLNLGGAQTTLVLDADGNGVIDQIILPDTVLDSAQSQDLIAPQTSAVLSGDQGQPDFYRSDIAISLTAIDPVITGQENETSGILKTQYRLNGGAWLEYNSKLSFSAEGSYVLEFFSIDRAGNEEAIKTVSFTIDKTPPEAIIQFDPLAKNLKFAGTDNISPPDKIKVVEGGDSITLTDQAGNLTQLRFKDRNWRIIQKAEIAALSYNNQPVDLSKNKLQFIWLYDRNQKLVLLTQQVQAKNGFNILATYVSDKTLLIGRDKTGIFSKTLKGLIILRVATNKGDLSWNY